MKDTLKKYERTRILSARTLQISEGAPLCTKPEGNTKSFDIAVKEFDEKTVPLSVIKRQELNLDN